MRKKRSESEQKAIEIAQHERHREREIKRQRRISAKARDIGAIPKVADPERKERCKARFECFCREYLPEIFYDPWSPDQRKAIAKIDDCVKHGGLYCFAMPRGSGKTALVIAGVLWAIIYGYRRFSVVIGSDRDAAISILNRIKRQIEANPLFLADFPEACYPVKRLERSAVRAPYQTCKGAYTLIKWSDDEIILPTLKDSACSGGIIQVAGITGGIRGRIGSGSKGQIVRPDLVLIDDPQTDESAKSPTQVADRAKIIKGTILGLAGPGKQIAGFMPCTVIEPDDLSEQFLDRQKYPQWQGERTKTLYGWPEHEDRWEQYQKIRADEIRAGATQFPQATDFYIANQETMDAGCMAAWLSRKYPHESSAIQHAMDLYFDLGKAAFFAEHQNEPVKPESEADAEITVEVLASKCNGMERGVVPLSATNVVTFVDVQKECLFYLTLATDRGFSGHIADYGTHPDQKRATFKKNDIRRTLIKAEGAAGFEESIRAGLDTLSSLLLSRDWNREDGGLHKMDKALVDAHWGDTTDIVRKFARESPHRSILVPSFGIGVTASSLPFDEKKAQPGEIRKATWSMPKPKPGEVRHVSFDANAMKTFASKRLRQGVGGIGSFSIFGSAEDHQLLFDHLTSEYGILTTGRGRTLTEWKNRPNRDNDLWDCLVGCCVAASIVGCELKEIGSAQEPKRRRIRFSDLQRNAHG